MGDLLVVHDIVLISDRRVTSIGVQENGEPLVDVRGVLAVDGTLADPDGAYTAAREGLPDDAHAYLREGVVARLVDAQRALPPGYRLLVVEGYRPPALQQRIFDDYTEELRAAFPHMSAAELRAAASRYVSPIEVAPHTAGAAVDLTLVTEDGGPLDMGTRVNATPEESDGACYTSAAGISTEARDHRKILAAALEAAGLVNYPTEWWHWSYGDRYWSHTTNAPAALYGPLPLPSR
ncbi:D-alanyl-D-alanine dipeptidase [Sphaerisporangium siamense]|nr:D-alanyl-D-alanine dipeptidase [Sphaerisporangium siamense]